MKKNSIFSVIAVALTLSLVTLSVNGCMSTGSTQTVSTTVNAKSADTVKVALLKALQDREFYTKLVADGQIEATYEKSKHSVTVNIFYSADKFDIVYVKSTNLGAKDGKIHRNYERWINNVRKDTRLLLNQATN